MQFEEPTSPLWPLAEGAEGPGRAPASPSAFQRTRRRGDVLGRYFILQEIGRGGMGVVYSAFDPELDRKVALKILHPDRTGKDSGVGQARLLREAKALARLSHPNVIQVYDAGTVGEEVFIAMELAVGTALDTWLGELRPWRQSLAVLQEAGRGLAAAHAVGLVHRDFKPGNVLLGDDGRVRVLDFGIARPAGDEDEPAPVPKAGPASGSRVRLDSKLTREGVVLGTPRYMAPEALLGRPLDHRADQYSFCVTLWEAVHGTAPYAGETLPDVLREVLAGRIVESPGSRIPAWLRRILLRGLATDPAQRYPSMDALVDDLAYDRGAVRKRRVLAVAAALLIAAGGMALYLVNRGQDRLCAGAERRLAGIWDAERKASLQRAFLGSGRLYAGDAWSGVKRTLDRYTHDWTAMRTEACEATQVRGEQSPALLDLRMRCLDRRLREVSALTGLFASGDPAVVEKAVPASQGLPSLAECADSNALTAPVPPPEGAEARKSVTAIEERLAEARALWTTGRYPEGLKVAAAAVTSADRLGYPPARAEALYMRSRLEDSQSQFETAEATLFEALAAAEKGHHDALAARIWIDLAWSAGFRQMRFAEGERWARIAQASLDRLGGAAENPELDATLRSNLGAMRDLQGDHAAGIELLRQALAVDQKTLGPDHPAVSRELNRLGNALYQAQRYPEALDAYTRALELTRRALGPLHPTVAVRLGNIALVFEGQERFEDSLANQLAALDIEAKALGPTNPRLSITHGNLAALLMTMHRYDEALDHARQALAIDQANPDASAQDLGVSYLNIGDALFKLDRLGQALEANAQARALLTKSLGADHPWTASANTTYGQILVRQGRFAEAVPPLRRAVAGFKAAGEESTTSGAAQWALARALWDTGGDRKEAMALARKARVLLQRTKRTREKDVPEIDAWLAGRRERT